MINIINIAIICVILVVGLLLFKFKKLETLSLFSALKAETMSSLSGSKKLEYAVDWLYSQKIFKDSILRMIPKNVAKWFINFLFNKKKGLIEKEGRKKQ